MLSSAATESRGERAGNHESNADPKELAHFNALAQRWWDPDGPSKALLALNPVRLEFIKAQIRGDLPGASTERVLSGLRVLDVGCGGGILSEALAREGAQVTAIDLSADLLEVAKLHALGEALSIDYRLQSAEQLQMELARGESAQFDLICCMEMLEHVPDPQAILRSLEAMLAPSGMLVLSTLDRKPSSFVLGIVAAEYVLNLVPRGTHRYAQFIRPHELAGGLRALGLSVRALRGLDYTPWNNLAKLSEKISVNYLMSAARD